MKRIVSHIVLMLLLVSTSYGQAPWVHVHMHINNNDHKTRAKLTALITTLGLINGELGIINNQLKDAKSNHREQLDLQYKSNTYDKQSGFIANSLLSTALSFGPSLLAAHANLPYMTKEKRKYLREVAMDKAVLASLQFVSADKVKSARRQEIYRLRSKLLREYSKIDRDARSMLYLPIGGMVIKNAAAFYEMSKVLNGLKIAL